ncbi:hypothetical protein KI387_019726 [Taxus chinensis]|uniref:Mitochondrial inner membrane translocase subunit Tim17/Tim22/Tim23/peroxisomal protein PMP24 n=1 Tax=Taxus chinensis TaxID=29808 RepID=A0AA38G8E4_TAXCH|nr:hypothetical protein KI387_019726 [Taxus chinensis]
MTEEGDEKLGKVRYGPGRRPIFNYQGSNGWQHRICIPTLAAGVIGGGAGVFSAILKGHGTAKLALTYAVNSAIVTSCFCGAREIVRELRVADPEDPINSLLGGIASGGFLGRIQGGRPRAFYYAFLFATVGTGLHFGTLKLQEYRSQKNLESSSPDTSGEVESCPSEKKWWDWPDWAPIQKLDEEAAAKKAQERDIQIQRTLDKLKKGDSL